MTQINRNTFLKGYPTIEPRADGEWRMVYHNARHTLGHIECGQCGYRTKNHAKYNFCPNCGSYNGANIRYSEGLE